MILIDTNIAISFLRGSPEIVDSLRKTDGELLISSISLGELYIGANKSDDPIRNSALVDDFINTKQVTVVNFEKKQAEEYGLLCSSLEFKGLKISVLDSLIASTAKSLDIQVLTRDKKHFERLKEFGVKVKLI